MGNMSGHIIGWEIRQVVSDIWVSYAGLSLGYHGRFYLPMRWRKPSASMMLWSILSSSLLNKVNSFNSYQSPTHSTSDPLSQAKSTFPLTWTECQVCLLSDGVSALTCSHAGSQITIYLSSKINLKMKFLPFSSFYLILLQILTISTNHPNLQ